jgi:nucleoid-associated protein YgaU
MTTASSRFPEGAAAAYSRCVGDDEHAVELRKPRFAGVPEAALRHRVMAGDRLDLLATRYFGDPLQYWRIVDANPTIAPESLLDVGRVLSIPRGG